MPLPLVVLVLWPLVEIALFVTIGGAIGVWATLAIVVGTAVLGLRVMRGGGGRAMGDVQRAVSGFRDPTRPMAEGALTVLAGALLIAPGFLTDVLGVLLLLAPVRAAVLRRLSTRMRARVAARFPEAAPHRYGRGTVIDGYYVDDTGPGAAPPPADGPAAEGAAAEGRARKPSGWTQGPQAH